MSVNIKNYQQESTSNKRERAPATREREHQQQEGKGNIKSFLKEYNYKSIKEMCIDLNLNYNSIVTLIKRDKKDRGNRIDKKLIEISLQINNVNDWEQLQKIINVSKINIIYAPIKIGE